MKGALIGTKKMDGVRKGVTVGAEVSYVGGWLMIIGWVTFNNAGYWLELLKAAKTKVGGLQYVQSQNTPPYNVQSITLCLEVNKLFWTTNTYLYSVCVIVQQQHSRARHFLGLHHSLQISQQTHVFGHVSGQNLKTERERKISSVSQQ